MSLVPSLFSVRLDPKDVEALSDGSETHRYMRSVKEYLEIKRFAYLLSIPVDDTLRPASTPVASPASVWPTTRSGKQPAAVAASARVAVSTVPSEWIKTSAGTREWSRREDERLVMVNDAHRARGNADFVDYKMDAAVFLTTVREEDRALFAFLLATQAEGPMRDLARTLADGSMSGRQLWVALSSHYLGEMRVQQDLVLLQLRQRCYQWSPDDTPSSVIKDVILIDGRQYKESDVFMQSYRVAEMFIRSLAPEYAVIKDKLVWAIDYEAKEYSLKELQTLFAKHEIVNASHGANATTSTRVLSVQDSATGAWRAVRGAGNRKQQKNRDRRPSSAGAAAAGDGKDRAKPQCWNCKKAGHKQSSCEARCTRCDHADHAGKGCEKKNLHPRQSANVSSTASASASAATVINAPTASPVRAGKGRVHFVLAVTTSAARIPELEALPSPVVLSVHPSGEHQAKVKFYMDTASPLNFVCSPQLLHNVQELTAGENTVTGIGGQSVNLTHAGSLQLLITDTHGACHKLIIEQAVVVEKTAGSRGACTNLLAVHDLVSSPDRAYVQHGLSAWLQVGGLRFMLERIGSHWLLPAVIVCVPPGSTGQM